MQLTVLTKIGILCGLGPLFLTAYVFKKKAEIKRQLEECVKEYQEPGQRGAEVKKIVISLLKPFLPSPLILEKMQVNLQRAGLKHTPEEVYAVRWILAIVLGILMAVLQIPSASRMLLFGGATGALCYMMPQVIISTRIKTRQKNAKREILDFIDLVASGMDAGLDLGNSIEKVIRQTPGILAEEFQRAYSEIELNRRRSDAFKDMSKRIDVEDVTLLVDAITQAEKTGVPMARVLKDQAARIRQNYKTNALKIAQAASVKMLAPVILFIVPALFIVVLGPPLLGIGKLLKF